MKDQAQKTVNKNLVYNQLIFSVLVLSYCFIYGMTAQIVLSGLQLLFFLSSLVFAISIFYIRDPHIKKERAKKGILYSQIVGTILVFAYVIVFGVSSLTLLKGFQLLFFMSSFVFAMSIFYLRDPDRIKEKEDTSISITTTKFLERSPCFINSKDMSWLIRELNSSLTTVIGFTELMLSRDYTEHEKEYMLRNIYSESLNMSANISKVSSLVQDTPAKPKEIHEVVNLLDDKNFK